MNLPDTPPTPKTNLRAHALVGFICTILLFVIIAGWMSYTQINSAVVSVGSVVVKGKPKSVQHLDGGIVEEILVSDGQEVSAGDTIIVLDDTILQANLDIYAARLAEALALQGRLQAEQSGAEEIRVVNIPATFRTLIDVEPHLVGQREIFKARRDVQTGQIEQLEEKILQFENQKTGVDGLISSKRDQIGYVEKELANVRQLNEQGLALDSQLLTLQKSHADLLGQISEHESELARIDNSIYDARLQILQAKRQFREQVVTELRDVTISIEELIHQIVSTEKQIDRVQIKAPVDGIIHELQIFTLGGVVPPGATIVQLIPVQEGVEFQVNVDPASVDQIYIGQPATVRFPAFNQRSTPELTGTVTAISASSVTDQQSGFTFFRVGLDIPQSELDRLGDKELVPGMPVEALLTTGERSVLSYLTKPLTDQINKAFREE